MRKMLFLVLSVSLICGVCCAAELQKPDPPSSKEEDMRSMLHSLSLYILAAEVLAYFEDGAGDEAAMTKIFKQHPGWIPAFAQATFHEDNGCVYVPLGQYLWRIGRDDHGEMKFALLFPRDAMRATAKSQARSNSKFDHSL